MLETRHAGFRQRIDVHNLAAIALGLLQGSQHTRMIRAWVLANDKDRLCQLEVFECYGSLPHADRFAERGAARFVAHIRAVGKIVGAKLPYEELIEKRGFVAGAARGVEDRFVRMVH